MSVARESQGEHGIYLNPREIMDSLRDELLVVDSNYSVIFANLPVRSRLGQENRQISGRPCYEVWQGADRPCAAPLWECPLRDVVRTGQPKSIIHRLDSQGPDTYLRITAYPLQDGSDEVSKILELRSDVTAERALETQILRRHHQLSILNNISSTVSLHHDLDTILKVALDNVLEIINGVVGGILLLDKKTDTLHYRVYRGLSANYAGRIRLALGEGIAGTVARTGEPMLIEDVSKDPRAANPDLMSAEGLKAWVSIPLKARNEVLGVMNIVSHVAGRFSADDVSLLTSIGHYLGTAIEQARLYEGLARVGERYRALLQHALTAQEQERRRIARELHDETSQAITSLTLSLKAIMSMAEMKGIKDEELLGRLRITHEYAVHAGNEIVKLMKELRPTLLDELGMAAAIHRYAKDTLQTQGINILAEFSGTDRRFQPEIEVTLFRVAQGIIGNILQHSGASNVSVKLECDEDRCMLNIRDDGRGFDVSRITGVSPTGRGAGLFTMKERVRLVGGACHIESEPGKGTDITVRVPLADEIIDEEDTGLNS